MPEVFVTKADNIPTANVALWHMADVRLAFSTGRANFTPTRTYAFIRADRPAKAL